MKKDFTSRQPAPGNFQRNKGGKRDASRGSSNASKNGENHYLYGLHTVRAALENPQRIWRKLLVTRNALQRLDIAHINENSSNVELSEARNLDRLVGKDAVHQGVVLQVEPLNMPAIEDVASEKLLVVLDQITDPHNVGAILRSAVAMGAGAVIVTARNAAPETGVLAKSASGALDMIPVIAVRNLSKTIEELNSYRFQTVGLDSEGEADLEGTLSGDKIALVMGAEGRGLREKTRLTCTHLARLDMPGKIKSLNVSNAAALALYATHRHLAVEQK